jgi:hypothetical protein
MFQRNVLPPSLEWESKPRMKIANRIQARKGWTHGDVGER